MNTDALSALIHIVDIGSIQGAARHLGVTRGTLLRTLDLRVPLRLLASQDYLDRQGTPQTLAELAEHRVLGWRRPRQRADEWPLLTGGSLSVLPWITAPEPLTLMTLAVAGAGILLGPRLPIP